MIYFALHSIDKQARMSYEKKIEQLAAGEVRLKRAGRYFLAGKLVAFAAIVAGVYRMTVEWGILSLLSALVPLAAYVWLVIADDRNRRRLDFNRRCREVCRNGMAALAHDFSAFPDGGEFADKRHPFSFDLDIFGPKSLYNRLCRTVTQRGGELLAERLTQLTDDPEEIRRRQEAVAELAGMEDWRIRFMARPATDSRINDLSQLLRRKKLRSRIVDGPLCYVLAAVTLTLLLLASLSVVPWAFFVTMVVLQLLLAAAVGRLTMEINSSTDRLDREYRRYCDLLADIRECDFRSETLRRIRSELFERDGNCEVAFRRLARLLNLFEQRGNELMYTVLNGTVMFDVLLIKSFLRWQERYLHLVPRWVDCIGELDMLVSLATFAADHPQNAYPELLPADSANVVEAVGVSHPFLPLEKAVPNDFVLPKHNISIVTGANMAGKSTFLRTIGVTYVLACCGAPVQAVAFRFLPVSLFSSMRTSDDLTNDVSYFNAELLRLEQLLAHVGQHRFTLVILDEILKGTNSRDKLKGSVLFLRTLTKYPVSGIIATHDLELAKLEEEQPSVYANYCFEIALADDVSYSYTISRGVARNLNATHLLSKIISRY